MADKVEEVKIKIPDHIANCDHWGNLIGVGQSVVPTPTKFIIFTTLACSNCGEQFLSTKEIPITVNPITQKVESILKP